MFALTKDVFHQRGNCSKAKESGILGLDLMKAYQCSVDIGNEILVVNGREKRLSIEGFIGCYSITVSKTVSKPPRSEIIVPGKVFVPEGSTLLVDEITIGPLYNKCINKCALTAKTIVSPSETAPVQLTNTKEDAKIVHSGTIIGQLSEVAQVDVSLPQEKLSGTNVLRTDCTVAEDRAESIITADAKGKGFFFEVRFLFAKHNLDLARTYVVKQQINKGDSRSIKQQPRMIPANLTEEVIKPSRNPW